MKDMRSDEFIFPIIGKNRFLAMLYRKNKTLFFFVYPLLFIIVFLLVYRGILSVILGQPFFEINRIDILYAFAALIGGFMGALIIYKKL